MLDPWRDALSFSHFYRDMPGQAKDLVEKIRNHQVSTQNQQTYMWDTYN